MGTHKLHFLGFVVQLLMEEIPRHLRVVVYPVIYKVLAPSQGFVLCTPPKTNMTVATMEKQPFEDVSPIKNGSCPLPCWFSGGMFSHFIMGILATPPQSYPP